MSESEEEDLDAEEGLDAEECLDVFQRIQDAVSTGEYSIGVVAFGCSAMLATCLLESMKPGEDVEQQVAEFMSEVERSIRDIISGEGPVKLEARTSKTN